MSVMNEESGISGQIWKLEKNPLEILELKNTISQVKNLLDRLNRRKDQWPWRKLEHIDEEDCKMNEFQWLVELCRGVYHMYKWCLRGRRRGRKWSLYMQKKHIYLTKFSKSNKFISPLIQESLQSQAI